ncbi:MULTISPECIES: decarboxylating NADP(+)-dependent phosphogluconate dehydrogenase [Parabacteroides]|uniref:6-phosphogluconate dehydrogenase, decarboxylating n=1 Tax=Parabacteroides gordonii MS-1 = DSM 23371 TaxID=1203610 RepID=A0A0F5IUX5_9BACT|nr:MULTISPECIES: decarboxylating NADP(+)-dependent phosphogluconate dehydrogenase [Parabacteroides]KKB49359.1 6-phosphogluconate dehydrogenase (decarboxylating) [Parabacteroides gordonii MS-1 = DSM 23371]KKB51273.1 6-phosphogluconate dehydrogenase (decarboxylating) [Parabacteroides sp. HGS0025]MCA5585628.1 decarboxylating NADP(+)-dependent phosphogluconate dehydrogenase [Parabacteroides gordonii]RGP16919.1 decarboxylating NADP(+)-dependent phosphogluconate dehydrogenase [Parabacteroides gordoni
MKKADIGLIGLAVMGENLALNMESKGFTVAVYNRNFPGEEGVVDRFVNGRGKGKNFIATHSIEELTDAVKRPRIIMMMIKAGAPVDEMIEQLLPHMSPGDVIIDGGNSDFHDTERRVKEVEAKGLYFVGSGISGGEEGALHGPSVMPGGSPEAWPIVKDILQGIAAKLDDGTPCCQWIGRGGAGHFVKMVHNGIEYGDMQLISEAYSLLKNRKGLDDDEMSVVFEEWNKGELDSFLIEITKNILRFRDEDGKPLLDKILDVAGQKGTGKWSAIAAMDESDPLTLVTEAVYARLLSALYAEREKAAGLYPEPVELGENLFVEEIRQALYASKLISYAQGFSLIRRASEHYGWELDYGTIAQIWRKGCIIRSVFLQKITEAYRKNPKLENLLFDDFFRTKIQNALPSWRKTVSEGALSGVALPAMSSALSYFDGLRTLHSAANLIQAQRDYFGAHTYERTDRERGIFFHTNWTGEGGNTVSGTYNV